MNNKYFILGIVFGFLTLTTYPKIKRSIRNPLQTVEEIEEFNNFYKSEKYYLGGQPSLEAIKWLKSEGVSLIINLRSEGEVDDFYEEAFHEENVVKEYGLEYKSIPVSYPDSYSPETLSQFINTLYNHEGKVFIHCASGGRVRLFFMAYLVKAKNYSLEEAIEFGEKLGYTFLLENILGKEIKMEL